MHVYILFHKLLLLPPFPTDFSAKRNTVVGFLTIHNVDSQYKTNWMSQISTILTAWISLVILRDGSSGRAGGARAPLPLWILLCIYFINKSMLRRPNDFMILLHCPSYEIKCFGLEIAMETRSSIPRGKFLFRGWETGRFVPPRGCKREKILPQRLNEDVEASPFPAETR